MACFPGLAAAEENSGIQYESDVPTVPEDQDGSNIPSKKHSGDSNTSDEADAGASGSNTSGGAGSGGGDDSGTGGGTSTGQGNQAQGGGGGKGADGSQAAGGVGDGKALPTATSSAVQASSEDGGSSPLVPILIAAAVLATISIGAYYYRQRRDPGSPVSPNAS
jgi:cobalamin biosynthesis Mg chelatase CobN